MIVVVLGRFLEEVLFFVFFFCILLFLDLYKLEVFLNGGRVMFDIVLFDLFLNVDNFLLFIVVIFLSEVFLKLFLVLLLVLLFF